ncbi:HAD-IB family hydrolase [Streptomyces sp. NBC_00243]|uniref:HAD-IB family hydrolase n=1 Tax=Streptomyces sp. NBC_00243 TaxID=2975688 RepID=UPI002DD9546F|nr:HAD-IB family hydrolase [Streptomyces sp. NBC_00243]WRZ17356.1 HAD-IB family hydrolase [Streptomyces sp. NBC_00243]
MPRDDDSPTDWNLTGHHILLTGATGFLGQAILERLIVDYPATRITVLIRNRGTVSASSRLTGLARKPIFRALRERIGYDGVLASLTARVEALEGDLSDDVPALPDDLTAVIHCASTVSFDPPIDEAFRVNVKGAANLYDAIAKLESKPHVVHVSTAYVSALHKGAVPEEPLRHEADWRSELAYATAARSDAEQASRRPAALRALLATARADHRKVGPAATAKAAEEARLDRVTAELIEAGRLRAQTLGWTDVYTLTKALGERVAEEYARSADLPVSVVRPTIVQSSLRHPYPGWFDSYKMMDPIILAYGRGQLPEFPVDPDSVIDIVPVDLVTNALLAVTAAPGERGTPAYFHVGTGARNPLTQRELHLNVLEYFRTHPLPASSRGHIKVPLWQFRGTTTAERMLRTGERAVKLADRALQRLPSTDRTRGWLDKTHQDSRQTEMLRRLFDLYSSYGGVEAVYADTNVQALLQALPPERTASADFDSAGISWPYYLQEVYCPSVTAVSRRTSGRRKLPVPNSTLPLAQDVAAVFDLEGTVLASNLIEAYLWARLVDRPRATWPRELVSLAAAAPGYVGAERRDRGEFIRSFMKRYAGASEAQLRALVRERLGDALLHRTRPEAIRRIRDHRAAGHRTVLITGTADFLLEPLRPLFDEIAASRLDVRDGVLTGFLQSPPLVGEARASWVSRYAARTGVDVQRSYAYGDSFSDRPLLELVGNPVAVNPDPRLYRHARRQTWTVEQWGVHTGSRTEAAMTALTAVPSFRRTDR